MTPCMTADAAIVFDSSPNLRKTEIRRRQAFIVQRIIKLKHVCKTMLKQFVSLGCGREHTALQERLWRRTNLEKYLNQNFRGKLLKIH